MLALGEYRRPPKVGPNYTAIGHANIAGQQVVQIGASKRAQPTSGSLASPVVRLPEWVAG